MHAFIRIEVQPRTGRVFIIYATYTTGSYHAMSSHLPRWRFDAAWDVPVATLRNRVTFEIAPVLFRNDENSLPLIRAIALNAGYQFRKELSILRIKSIKNWRVHKMFITSSMNNKNTFQLGIDHHLQHWKYRHIFTN